VRQKTNEVANSIAMLSAFLTQVFIIALLIADNSFHLLCTNRQQNHFAAFAFTIANALS
jgi:hypothetical protein